ncbi:hypothetical protein [Pectobacterium polaris]|uniref:BRCT domain-containing protein n=1 Tax=Pectobacterium polaris TaxID=2042057 RepID=A0AAW5GKH9_9GAMM|nr:hypothetical protein [Pectobacterium polaris]MCL6353622.1 hypothetical protein [Pectobacterium polaris]MCL6371081.1 hypothetical protein [Pectobacterium polaris]
MDMSFVYINAQRVISAYYLSQVSESEEHFQGICHRSNQLKTFRKDRLIKNFLSYEEALKVAIATDASQYLHLFQKPKANFFEVCFTGFKKGDKDRLVSLAIENKMSVRSSVTQNLQVLCCGYNAGPTKVTAARMKGVLILDEEQFFHMVSTGEVPDI